MGILVVVGDLILCALLVWAFFTTVYAMTREIKRDEQKEEKDNNEESN